MVGWKHIKDGFYIVTKEGKVDEIVADFLELDSPGADREVKGGFIYQFPSLMHVSLCGDQVMIETVSLRDVESSKIDIS